MRFFPRALVALAVAAITALAVPMERRAQFPDPNDDPFYKAPGNIGTYANGQIVQSRSANTNIGTLNKVASYQLSYRTTNTKGEPELTVATVWIPNKPASPPKIFSYQTFEDSTQLDCAPSYNFLSGLDQPNVATTDLYGPIEFSWALNNGYYVVSPDHEGPTSAFIAGYQEGRASLDGVRALRNFKNLPQDAAVGFYGYSGGGHATGWTASLAASYAPDINVVGAAFGGLPASTRDIFNFLNKGAFSGFAIAGVSGLGNAYPELENFIVPQLNTKGQEAFKNVRSRNFCLAQVIFTFPFTDVYSLTKTDDTNLLNQPIPTKVLAAETLLQTQADHEVPVVKFPQFMWHALPDEIVPFAPAQQYVKEQCAKGANINWNIFPIAEHATAQIFGLVPALNWMQQALEGKAPKVTCGTPFTPLTGINSPSAQQVLGSDLANRLASLNGQKSPFGTPYGPITPPAA